MDIAKELGCTLAELTTKMAPEELALWNMYFQIRHEDAEKEAKLRKR